jgi:outer membrane receptor for ferrienterochelin and colicins
VTHVSFSRVVAACLLGGPVVACAVGDSEPAPDTLGSMSLQELMQVRIDTVYGASKYEQKVTRAPASVTILTAEDLVRFGYRTLAEALRSVRGLYVSNDRNYSYLGTRGFLRPGDYNSRLLVLIDGHRMNDDIYDAAYFAREGLPSIENVERVEFVRGPSSSIYGSSAFFGVVNIVTKRAEELGGADLAVAVGSLDEKEVHGSYGDVKNGFATAVQVNYYENSGYRRLYYPQFDPAVSSNPRAADGGIARNVDGETAYGLTGSVAWGELRLSASTSSRFKDVPTASFETVFNAAERTADRRSYLDLQYRHAFSDALNLSGRLTYDRYSYLGDYPIETAAEGDPSRIIVSKDDSLGTWAGTEWQVTRTLAGGHTLVAGVEYRENLQQRQLSYDDIQPRVYTVDERPHSRNAALYAQGEFTLSPKVLLNAGLRYDDYFDTFGGTFNPRIGLIVSPNERSTVKVLYGKAFRAPSAYEQYYYEANETSRRLQPETIRTYELVFEQYLGPLDRVNLSAYRYAVDGLITQLADADQNLYFANVTRVTARGAELEFERRYENGPLLRMSYARQRTRDDDTGQELTSSPRQLAKFNLGLAIWGAGDLGTELQYQSATRTLAGARVPGFTLANLYFRSARRVLGAQLSAGLYNVFDRRYAYAGAEDHSQDTLQQDGRTWRIEMMRHF